MAGAFEPIVAGAEVGLAAEVRAALVEGAHVGVQALAVTARALSEAARRIDQLDVRPSLEEVGRRALGQRHALDGRAARDEREVAQRDRAAEAARKVGPQEAEQSAGD